MKRKFREDKFLDYLEGRLSAAEAQLFSEALATDPQLKASLAAYQQVIAWEQSVAAKSFRASPALQVKVMAELDRTDLDFFRRWQMRYQQAWYYSSRILVTAAAAMLVIILAVQMPEEVFRSRTLPMDQSKKPEAAPTGPRELLPLVAGGAAVGKAAESRQAADEETASLTEDQKSGRVSIESGKDPRSGVDVAYSDMMGASRESHPPALPPVPPGQKLVTVPAAPVSGVEGWTRPGSRVDVTVTEERDGELVSRVIAENVMVHSAGREATLAADSAAATAIQEARQKGTISLNFSSSSDARGGGVEYRVGPSGSLSEVSPPAPAYYFRHYSPYPPAGDNERYGSYEENPRIFTRDEALSTFSIDVDTGSYTNTRRFLNQGRLPPPDSIRIEEFLNYFDYNYPQQQEKPFAVYYEVAPAPLDAGRYLLKLGIKARDTAAAATPWNLVFLIDVSGSMAAANKLDLVKRALHILVRQMRPQDQVSLVTYANGTEIKIEAAQVKDQAQILSLIDGLGAAGGTYGSGGIQLAYDVAERHKIPNGVNRVILATDGDFNVGITSLADLIRMVEQRRRGGVSLTTLGFGEANLKEEIMEQLANKGNGNYFYIDSFREARKVFETDLYGTIETVAKDVKLQIEFNPAQVQQYRLIGYDNRRLRKEDFNNDAIDAGEIGAGHTVTALYELVLNNSPLAQGIGASRYQPEAVPTLLPAKHADELAFLKIRYKDPAGHQSKLLEYPIQQTALKDAAETSAAFRFAAAVAAFGQLLRQSQYVGNYTWDHVIELAAGALGPDALGYRREALELMKNARSLQPHDRSGSTQE